ncbi:MAG: hypothetical protein R3B45_09345 [Bdellovibrionota bacterium]
MKDSAESNWSLLIVNLSQKVESTKISENLGAMNLPCNYYVTTSQEEASLIIESASPACLVLIAESVCTSLTTILKDFKDKVACLPDLQLIVNSNPSAKFLTTIFEFGIEQIAPLESWYTHLNNLCTHGKGKVIDPNSIEHRCLQLMKTIRIGNQEKIVELSDTLTDDALTDYLAAFAYARAKEALGQYRAAICYYEKSSTLNTLFRPALTGLAENLLLMNSLDKAVDYLTILEKTNPFDVTRKADLSSAYLEMGEMSKAKQIYFEAKKLQPNHSRLLEIEAQEQLKSENIEEALKTLSKIDEASPFFAAKLNEFGIALSKSGKGKAAIELYKRAHKIVRPELKYKISLNSALACRRLKQYEMALQYTERCETEFGSTFEKLTKLKNNLKSLLTKSNEST